jgi:DHA2 family methylenomycin A resistance protein-like MFS transporter
LAFTEEVSPTPARHGLDLAGQAPAILVLVSLTGAVIEAGSLGWRAPLVETGLVLSVVAGVGFVLVEMRSGVPMVPLSLFRNSNFSAATAIGFIISLTIFGLVFLLSLYFQRVLLYSPSATGLAFVPFGLMTIATNIAAGCGRANGRAPGHHYGSARSGRRLCVPAALLHGSTAGQSQPPASTFM